MGCPLVVVTEVMVAVPTVCSGMSVLFCVLCVLVRRVSLRSCFMMLIFSCVSVFAKAHSAIVSPLVMVVSVAARAVSRRRVGVNEILPLLKFFCTGEIGCSWVDVRKLLYRGGLGE